MAFSSRITCLVLAAICGTSLGGCFLSGPSQQDEEKEPHYLKGRSRVNQMDYKGAIEAFTEALEVIPRSASAHLVLACLYEEKDPDPAAAIYHYERYLKLCPDSDKAGPIGQRIVGLKQELAKSVFPLPSSPSVQREFERLAEENRQLREEVEKWRAHFKTAGGATNQISPPLPAGRITQNAVSPPVQPRNEPPTGVANLGRPNPAPGSPAAPRTHKVQPGESPASIARKYGVKVESLMAANPGLNPRRLQIGQSLNVPPP